LDTLKTNGSVQKVENQLEKLQSELAEKDLLIKEMNHRAKNNLALAASLVKMEAGYSNDPGALFSLKQTQKRLETLASIHELMYKKTMSNELQVPFLGEVPIFMGIREGGDQGTPGAAVEGSPVQKVFFQIAEKVAQQIALINAIPREVVGQ
jgi:hypothetical protein